jgi:hypothetical protein
MSADMDAPRRSPTRIGLIAAALAILSSLTASSEQAVTPQQLDRTAAAILARARQWAGGAALDRVQSVSIKGGERTNEATHPYEIRLLRPNRFQSSSLGFVHTFDGPTFWMTSPADFRVAFTPEMQATAERGLLDRVVDVTMSFLIRAPEGRAGTVTGVGRVNVEGLTGDGLLVTLKGREVAATTFVFDPADGRPLGAFRNTRTAGEKRVYFFKDHREIGGVRFPFLIELRFRPGPGAVDYRIEDLQLNGLKPADFQRKTPGASPSSS